MNRKRWFGGTEAHVRPTSPVAVSTSATKWTRRTHSLYQGPGTLDNMVEGQTSLLIIDDDS